MEKLINQSIPGKDGRDIVFDFYFKSDDLKRPLVIFSHGFKGFKDWGHFNPMAQYMVGSGFNFIKHNFSFGGVSKQNPNEVTDLDVFSENNFIYELNDLELLLNWVESSVFNFTPNWNGQIFLIGHSRGGGISILKAAEDSRVKRVVSWAAPNTFENKLSADQIKKWKKNGVHYVENTRTGVQMPLKYQLYESFIKNKKRLDIMDAVSKLKVPFLIVHGSSDVVVPVSEAEQMYKQGKAAQLVVIPNGNHSFGAQHPYENTGTFPLDVQQVLDHTIAFLKD